MSRRRIEAELREALEAEPWIEAAWVGGSAAFGRDDERSDLDLQVLAPVDRADDVFALVEACLERVCGVPKPAARGLSGIRRVLRVPEPAWHGHRQRFYQLRGLPESVMVDLCVMRADRLGPFLDPARHGAPIVWFDRVGAVVPTHDPTLDEVLRRRMDQLRDRAAVLAHIPRKEWDRGNVIEAADFYQRLLLVPLVEVLRAQYSPRRQDFGLRYLRRDLPAEVCDRIERLMLPSRDTLGDCIDEARAWLDQELSEHPAR